MSDDKMSDGLSGAASVSLQSYDIAPEDQGLADAIIDEDPRHSPGASEIIGAVKMPDHIPVTALPPAMQEKVRKMADSAPAHLRDEVERHAVKQLLEAQALRTRVKTGFSANASGYHRELGEIALKYEQLKEERDGLYAAMSEIVRYDVTRDANGSVKQVPVFKMSPADSIKATGRMNELSYRMSLLSEPDGKRGPEAVRRLQRALAEEVAHRKTQADQIAIDREARKMAAEMNRRERVEAKAKLYAKHTRPSSL